MFAVEILMLGLALAIDAAVASFALGLIGLEIPHQEKWKRGLLVALIFGFFQFLMLWLGSLGGYLLSFSSFGHLFHLIVALIFLIIAVKIFQESFEKESKNVEWGLLPITLLGIATSVDALAAGVSFGTLPQTYFAALEVGCVTSTLCGIFYSLSQILSNIPHRWLLRFAGNDHIATSP